MKPHLRLHVTQKGVWWISLHSPLDPNYTIASTRNYPSPMGAAVSARHHWNCWTRWARQGRIRAAV